MVSEQEAREAVVKLRDAYDLPWELEMSDDDEARIDNEIETHETTLIQFAKQELKRREAERAERELPIDAEWLESIGWERRVTAMGNTYRADGNFHEFGGVVFLCGCELKNVKTRGQLLDLLRALKGGAT